ncbi:hypothetical protein MWH25_11290 [Natroniella acetigena]|uniref:hypothetical protein n=1 Tax=Natroniella acetigena TaxID=52004 RepID=UPI002009E99B|nr:hypothetical protein [Natroniella acetigena]MCK8828317.1 hypothetical protein [Natroniella acetigena]
MNAKSSKNLLLGKEYKMNWECKICGKEIYQQDLLNRIGNVYLEHYWTCLECGGKLKKQ